MGCTTSNPHSDSHSHPNSKSKSTDLTSPPLNRALTSKFSKYYVSDNPATYRNDQCIVKIVGASNVPRYDTLSESDPYIRIKVGVKKQRKTKVKQNDPNPVFNQVINLTGAKLDDDVLIQVWDHDTFKFNNLVGEAKIKMKDLVKRPQVSLMMSKRNGDVTVRKASRLPTIVEIKTVKVPSTWPQPQPSMFSLHDQYDHGVKQVRVEEGAGEEEDDDEGENNVSASADIKNNKHNNYNNNNQPSDVKHVMMLTRGTRGDVQPFVALARGLANSHGWIVTICTEIRYKEFVQANAKNLERGAIRYRPSGGDTSSRIDKRIAKWAMQHTSEVMQIAMLARSEREFFSSEPAMYYWAETLRPDYLVYGFTMAAIAMIISEKLKIPLCGFILQPTVIPSQHYTAVIPISTHFLSFVDRMEESVIGHDTQSRLKAWMDNDPFYQPLNKMRERRGLKPFTGNRSSTWDIIFAQESPVVVPIAPAAFGGRPSDWPDSVTMTDFIFLRGSSVPELKPLLKKFIDDAKADNAPLVLVAFSSMPVPRDTIIKDALRIVNECKLSPRVIALSGEHLKEKLSKNVDRQYSEAKTKNKIFEDAGADFGTLFSHLQALVIHGGLGTTAEALRRGVPTMVCGVLLMDQRFWGRQCHALGVGPEMCHITSFYRVCVERIDSMLDPDSPYHKNAKELSEKLKPQSSDGVPENVQTVYSILKDAKPIEPFSPEKLYESRRRRSSAAASASAAASQTQSENE